MPTTRTCNSWKVFWPQTRFCSVTRGPEQPWTGSHRTRPPSSTRLCLPWRSSVGSVWRPEVMERFDEYAPLWIRVLGIYICLWFVTLKSVVDNFFPCGKYIHICSYSLLFMWQVIVSIARFVYHILLSLDPIYIQK